MVRVIRRGLFGLMAVAVACAAPLGALAQTAAAPVDVMAIRADDRILGDVDAPVTVVEYASFTCSHCAEWWTGVFPDFKARFIDTGRARLVFRDLPTAPAEAAYPAAMLARCAAPERFYDVAGSLLGGRMALTTMADVPGWLTAGAQAGGMDTAAIQTCLADEQNLAALQTRIEAARAAGVTGTPTFFVNGARTADHDLPTLEAAIVAAEARAAPGAP